MRTMTKNVLKEEGDLKMQWSKNHIGVQVGPGVMYKILQKMSCLHQRWMLFHSVFSFLGCWDFCFATLLGFLPRHLRTCQGQWRSREGTEGNTETSREGQGKSRGGAFGLLMVRDVRKTMCYLFSDFGGNWWFPTHGISYSRGLVASASPAGSL